MGKQATASESGKQQIAVNRRARHDYHIEDNYEAGLVLEGWEVKSLRAGKANIAEGHIHVRNGEAWLTNGHFTPLKTASTHITPQANRNRKLLLNRHELDKLTGAVERKGYTVVPLMLYFKHGRAKLEIGVAKGKKLHDKRADKKDKDWKRQKERLMKHSR